MRVLRKMILLLISLTLFMGITFPAFADFLIYDAGQTPTTPRKDLEDPFETPFHEELNYWDQKIYRFDDNGRYIGLFGEITEILKKESIWLTLVSIGVHPISNDVYVVRSLRGARGVILGHQLSVFDGVSGRLKKIWIWRDRRTFQIREEWA